MSTKKCMISQPMAGKTEEEIVKTRNKWLKWCEFNNYEPVNTLFTDEWYNDEAMEKRGVVNKPICFLAKSIENMSLCNLVYFATDFQKARGCKIEHSICEAYGIERYYEFTGW